MEFEIKDLDRLYETLDKFHDTFVSIAERLNIIDTSLFSIAKSLQEIAVEMVAENETL